MSYDPNIILNVKPRTERGKNASRRNRAAGEVPVTVYGAGGEPWTGTINKKELAMHIRAHGRVSLFNPDFEGQTSPVKIADVQIHPIRSTLVHVDLMRLSLTEKSDFEIPIKLIGEPHGVKVDGGILDVVAHSVKIRCLPTVLPDFVQADVSALRVGDHLAVKDLQFAEGIELRTAANATVATVVVAGAEEPTAAGAATAEPEVAKKGKDAAAKAPAAKAPAAKTPAAKAPAKK
jgi:large subunit ribosomal protein L25